MKLESMSVLVADSRKGRKCDAFESKALINDPSVNKSSRQTFDEFS